MTWRTGTCTVPCTPCEQDVRIEYRYDAQGNWTERVVWCRWESNPNFERSNVERREKVVKPLYDQIQEVARQLLKLSRTVKALESKVGPAHKPEEEHPCSST